MVGCVVFDGRNMVVDQGSRACIVMVFGAQHGV